MAMMILAYDDFEIPLSPFTFDVLDIVPVDFNDTLGTYHANLDSWLSTRSFGGAMEGAMSPSDQVERKAVTDISEMINVAEELPAGPTIITHSPSPTIIALRPYSPAPNYCSDRDRISPDCARQAYPSPSPTQRALTPDLVFSAAPTPSTSSPVTPRVKPIAFSPKISSSSCADTVEDNKQMAAESHTPIKTKKRPHRDGVVSEVARKRICIEANLPTEYAGDGDMSSVDGDENDDGDPSYDLYPPPRPRHAKKGRSAPTSSKSANIRVFCPDCLAQGKENSLCNMRVLARHLKSVHYPEKWWKCKRCPNFSTTREDCVLRHRREVKKDGKKCLESDIIELDEPPKK